MAGKRILLKVSQKPGLRPLAAGRFGLSGPDVTLKPLFDVPAPARTGFALGDDATREHRWYLAEVERDQPLGLWDVANDWDLAHTILAERFGATGDTRLLAVEPDIEQAWVVEPPPGTVGPALAPLAPCEPAPQKGGPLPEGPGFAWHLEKRFTTLRDARNAVMSSGSDVAIVHLDTGFDPQHKTLPEKLDTARQRNFISGEPPNDATDRTPSHGLLKNPGHGTGTLGILAQITLRVEPQPEEDSTLIVADEATGLQIAEAVAGSRLHPTAVVLIGGSAAQGILDARGTAALIRVEGFRAAVERQAAEVQKTAPGARRLSGEAHGRLWGRVARFGWEGPASLIRLMVPRSSLPGVWEELARIAECGVVADVLSGVLWISLGAAAGREQIAGVTAPALSAGGHFMIARAPGAEGTARQGPVPETLTLMRALKQAFDPDGILNPGRFLV